MGALGAGDVRRFDGLAEARASDRLRGGAEVPSADGSPEGRVAVMAGVHPVEGQSSMALDCDA